MDRVLATKRPNLSIAGTQTWSDLLFLHWPVDTELLQSLLPKGLTVDICQGQAYIGIVPFMMYDVRPWWIPKWCAFNFLETNVRTYVHHNGEHPGVYFFSLDAASWLAVQAARIGWSLPYFHAKMTMQKQKENTLYEMTRKQEARLRVQYQQLHDVDSSNPESLEFFLAERYLLYTERSGRLYRGQVHHTPYPLKEAKVMELEQNLLSAAGIQGIEPSPLLAHYSSGVDVDIFPLLPIP